MKCPNCGKATMIYNYDTRDSGERVWRRKKCAACGYNFTTYECYVTKDMSSADIYRLFSKRVGKPSENKIKFRSSLDTEVGNK